MVLESPDTHTSRLSIDGQIVITKPPLQIKPGSSLQLSVQKTGNPMEIKVVNQWEPVAVTINTAQRKDLPRQDSMSRLFNAMKAVDTLKIPTASTKLHNISQNILDKLLPADRLRNQGELQRSFKQSGIFLEATLAQPALKHTPLRVERNLKTQLLRFYQFLKHMPETPNYSQRPVHLSTQKTPPPPPNPQSPPTSQPRTQIELQRFSSNSDLFQEFITQTESALSRVQLHQLASLPQEGQNSRTWMTEIPIMSNEGIDILQIIVEQETKNKTQEKNSPHCWSINFAIDIEGIGPLHGRVSLDQGVINASLWIEHNDSYSLFENELKGLRKQLTEAGLEVQQLDLHHGKPVANKSPESGNYVLNEQA